MESNKKRPLEEEGEQDTHAGTSIQSKQESSSNISSSGNNNVDSPALKKTRPNASESATTNPGTLNGATPATTSSSSSSPSISQAHQPQSSGQHQRSSQGHHPGPNQQQPQRSSRLDHAFFGIEVMDDVVRTIGEFLYKYCDQPNVEIEAKVGVIIDTNTGRRLELPVENEVVLSQGPYLRYRFSSDMTQGQHAHFNNILNIRHQESQKLEHQIVYKHTYEVDQFFSGPGGKVRVTRNQKTNEVVENGIVRKDRIANLDVYSPKNAFDFRVSVNVEIPVPAPTGTPQYQRNKDRVSYRHRNFKIDLTQVKSNNASNNNNQAHNYSQMRQPNSGNQMDLTHELEVEFVHPEELITERNIRINGGARPDRFNEVVGRF
ncbi:mRNA-capping enzyme subunit beta, partial [Entomortierella lignicola]